MAHLSSNTDPSLSAPFSKHTADAQSLMQGLVLPPEGYCFHCGDIVPTPPFYATILDKPRQMCCIGCQLAAQSIVEANLEQYYLDRTEINRTASLPSQLTQLQAYDHDDIKSKFVFAQDGMSIAELSVSNLRCAACTWLIETRLYDLEGVKQCQVNLTSQRMRVTWDESILPVSRILATISQLGYEARPYRQDTHEAMLARHNKTMLIRLGIAALGAMQAMMYAVGMYFGAYSGIDIEQRNFLRWVSLFVSVPVFFYSGIPFFTSAWSAIKARQVNMDVPVSIALMVTFLTSLYATITGTGETYYDSVSMFIFFLLAGRYVEHNARLKAANMANDLVVLEPTLIHKLGNESLWLAKFDISHSKNSHDNPIENSTFFLKKTSKLDHELENNSFNTASSLGSINSLNTPKDTDFMMMLQQFSQLGLLAHDGVSAAKITAPSLQVGDIVLVEAGAEVVADGILCSQLATVSQSLLTGESDLIVIKQGDKVIGGSQNDSQPFVMMVTNLPQDSQIGLIDRLINRALSEKPKIAKKADKWARWFVARILILSVVVFCGWYMVDPSQAIWATVAVLVATCPCALSLATPIALTVSTNRLATYGFLTTRGHTLQTISEVTHIAFDKTGTLTYGKPTLLYIEPLDTKPPDEHKKNKEFLLALAAAMEVGSRHPIAHALLDAAYQLHLPNLSQITQHPAGGVEAEMDGRKYRLGHYDFALNCHAVQASDSIQKPLPNISHYQANMAIVLSIQDHYSKGWQPLGYFNFNDKIRPAAIKMISDIKAKGIIPFMLTGDPSPQAISTANSIGIDIVYKGQTPTQKVDKIQQLQQRGHVVMMVGDGINDAPVLAAANISSAIAGAADLAQVASDSIILDGAVASVVDAIRIANKAKSIIQQNLFWALGYNGIVLVPAALGYVPPWLAAIGMSLSSLVVVVNALRLKRA